MILKTEELKNACSKILVAVDNSSISSVSSMLELRTIDGILYLNVTNREYFVKIKLCPYNEDFHATINASLFLKLISQITTDEIEFNVTPSTLNIKGNGNYKFPLIYDGDKILTLPEIIINNPTTNFNIDSNILNSILVYNSKEVSKISKNIKAVNPVQRLYYIDEQGAITFYNGACVNKFTLEKPVKMLLNSNLVKLFALFKNTSVNFTLGYDALSESLIQTKVKFMTEDISIIAILNCDDTLLKGVPVAAIRGRAFDEYPYTATFNRSILLAAIQRLTLFTEMNNNIKAGAKFIFNKSYCTISDYTDESSEDIKYANDLNSEITYEVLLDLSDLKLALEGNQDQYITLGFGNKEAIVIAKENIYNVIPETKE